MALFSHVQNAFTDLELVTFKILAEQLASAIGNARLFATIRLSEEKYRTILENIEEGYYEMTLDGRFSFISDSINHIFGKEPDQIIGLPYHKFFDAAHLAKVSQTFEFVSQNGRYVKSVESRISHPQDAGHFIEMSMLPIRNAEGQTVGLRGTIRDITERKQGEQLLIDRKVLERSNRELEQFAYVASHDLQEPLNKIRLFGDRIIAKNSFELDKTSQDYLARMLKATSRMQTLIDNLLALSRVATKGRPFVQTNLTEVLEEVVSDLEIRFNQTGGTLQAKELPIIEADPLQMHQLFQNLISNALKFHQQDKPPVIKLSAKLPGTRSGQKPKFGENYCQIIIEDNGIGFDKKFSSRIFQPFQRLHGHHTYEGTGMGLAICQRIVERHGGRITVTSTPNVGSTFTIILPMKQSREGLEVSDKK